MSNVGIIEDPYYESDIYAQYKHKADYKFLFDYLLEELASSGTTISDILASVRKKDIGDAAQALSLKFVDGRVKQYATHQLPTKERVPTPPTLGTIIKKIGRSYSKDIALRHVHKNFKQASEHNAKSIANIKLLFHYPPTNQSVARHPAWIYTPYRTSSTKGDSGQQLPVTAQQLLQGYALIHDIGHTHPVIETDLNTMHLWGTHRNAVENAVISVIPFGESILTEAGASQSSELSKSITKYINKYNPNEAYSNNVTAQLLKEYIQKSIRCIPRSMLRNDITACKQTNSVQDLMQRYIFLNSTTYLQRLSFSFALAASAYDSEIKRNLAYDILITELLKKYTRSQRTPRIFLSRYMFSEEGIESFRWVAGKKHSHISFKAFSKEFSPEWFAVFVVDRVIQRRQRGYESAIDDMHVQMLFASLRSIDEVTNLRDIY